MYSVVVLTDMDTECYGPFPHESAARHWIRINQAAYDGLKYGATFVICKMKSGEDKIPACTE